MDGQRTTWAMSSKVAASTFCGQGARGSACQQAARRDNSCWIPATERTCSSSARADSTPRSSALSPAFCLRSVIFISCVGKRRRKIAGSERCDAHAARQDALQQSVRHSSGTNRFRNGFLLEGAPRRAQECADILRRDAEPCTNSGQKHVRSRLAPHTTTATVWMILFTRRIAWRPTRTPRARCCPPPLRTI